jgi:hypothetical protein
MADGGILSYFAASGRIFRFFGPADAETHRGAEFMPHTFKDGTWRRLREWKKLTEPFFCDAGGYYA